MDRTRRIAVRYLVTGLLVLFVAVLVFGCGDRDRCEPPFSGGMVGMSGVLPEGPIEAGKDFGITVGIDASYVAELKDVDIEIALPPELEIETIVQPKKGPKVALIGNKLGWKTKLEPSFYHSLMGLPTSNEFTLWLKSKVNWKEWSHPVKIDVSLYFTSNGECRNYHDGYYSKTITWSREGYKDPEWIGPDGKKL